MGTTLTVPADFRMCPSCLFSWAPSQSVSSKELQQHDRKVVLSPASSVGPQNSLLSNCMAFSCSPCQSCSGIHVSPAAPPVWESQLGFHLNRVVNVQSVTVPCAYFRSIQHWQIGIDLCHMRSEATNPYHIWWYGSHTIIPSIPWWMVAKDCIRTLI